jgi:ATP-dependent RNA helicase RhlE
MVFTRTKHRANRLFRVLEKAGVKCERIHGNRSQSAARDGARRTSRAGKLAVLVATDIAARGIDIEALPHVVNFDVPGPAGGLHPPRRAHRPRRQTGDALTFVSPEELRDIERELAAIERAVGKRLPRPPLEDFDYEAARSGAERFEIPVGERIAAIRARKAEDRARARRRRPSAAQISMDPSLHEPLLPGRKLVSAPPQGE